MAGIPPKLIECPRCGNVDRVVGWDGYSMIKCPICALILRQATAAPAGTPADPPPGAAAAPPVSRAWTDYTMLPDLDEDAEPVASAPRPAPEPEPFNKPIPAPRAPDPMALPEFKRQAGPQNPIVFRPMIPGTTDPLLMMQDSSEFDITSAIEYESAAAPRDPGEARAATDGANVDIYMNRLPGSSSASRLPSWIFIPLTAVAVAMLLAVIGWLVVAAFTSSGRFSGQKEVAKPASEGYTGTKTAARALADQFLAATTIEQKLALVRDPERVRPLVEEFVKSIDPGKVREVRDYGTDDNIETVVFYHLATFENGRTRLVCVVTTPAGLKVDWEAYSRQGSATGGELFAARPLVATVRVLASPSRYFNWSYRDEKSWLALEISNADWPETMTGYVKADSEAAGKLAALFKASKSPKRVLLRIRVDETTPARKQCLIEDFVARSWIHPLPE